jgi:hypothetical protein
MANTVNVSTTTNTVTITPQNTTNVSVGATNTSVNVTQGSTSVVQVASIGPQGSKGDTGATGPQGPVQDTGSLLTTASYSNPNLTFTKGDGNTFSVEIEAGSTDTGSLLKTGSVSLNTLTFTKGDGSTFDLTVDTGSAETVDTGSLLTTASTTNATITFTKGDGSTFTNTINNVTNALKVNVNSNSVDSYYFVNFSNGTGDGTTIYADAIGESLKYNPGLEILKVANVSSSAIITNNITVFTSSVQDTYMLGFSGTTDGIANRSSYFLSFDNNSTALKNSNFGVTNFPISASDYYNRVIPCDDMTIADGKSIDITGMLIVSGASNINSRQVQIDLYTASITPNNTTNPSDPLNFTRAFQGSNIALDISAPFNSIHHFTQSFDISTLPTNSLIAVALSNDSAATAVTTDTNVSISLRLTRNYKKKN